MKLNFLKKILGDPNEKALRNIRRVVEEVNEKEEVIKSLSDPDLSARTGVFRKRLEEGETLDMLLPEAFACVREAARRALGQRHYDEQLIGAVALHRGTVTEMRTGEGKTLTATCPVYLNALAERGAHVVTVNDFLARRDAQWMGQVYAALGMTVGCIQHQAAFRYNPETKELDAVTRQEAYACDITYGTNNEFGFDYLRDNMVGKLEDMVQRELAFAIVDEVDSILIDEARTPLIISAPAEASNKRYYEFASLINRLDANEHYNVDEKMRAATLTEAGISKLEAALGVDNLYTGSGLGTVHHIEQALKARVLYQRDRDYVVKDDEVIIVDEFTGRMMPGRRFAEGLHQAIEAKENVKIQRESQTLATVTFQNYFRLYDKLAGMTGTAETEAEEFHKIYNLEVIVVPTHRPIQRQDLPDRIYRTEEAKMKAVAAEVKARHEAGQPVLIGTVSIEKNEQMSLYLEQEGVPHEILNAKNHAREATITAEAGRPGAVTLATNMAGRGVDIILGGSKPDDETSQGPWQEQQKQVLASGGLFVIGTERHESRRIDNQLRGRAGRQGDPGATQFYVSLEDDLMRIFGSDRLQSMMERLGVPDDMPIENNVVSRALESAQTKVEGHNFDLRKHLVEYDDIVNKHRETIYRKRREILEHYRSATEGKGSELFEQLWEMVTEEIASLVAFHTRAVEGGDWDPKEIVESLKTMYPVTSEVEEKLLAIERPQGSGTDPEVRTAVIEMIEKDALGAYDELRERIRSSVEAKDAIPSIERTILLRAIDGLWVEHLEAIDHLRQGIGLRGYGQRDPLVEYKREARRLFGELEQEIRRQVVYGVFKVSVGTQQGPTLMERQNITLSGAAKTMGEGTTTSTAASAQTQDKVGRNDPCPCGATKEDGLPKKYKHCHGK